MAKLEQLAPLSVNDSNSQSLSTYAWSNMSVATNLRGSDRVQLPPFTNDIYPSAASRSDSSVIPPAQIKPVLDKASGLTFTTAEQNKRSGQQPDYILGEDGKLRANPAKKTPNADGSVNIEIQGKNKAEIDGKKLADQLQKSAIKDLINYFRLNNPTGKIPQDWLDQLSREPDLPAPVSPLNTEPITNDTTAPQPEAQPKQSQPVQEAVAPATSQAPLEQGNTVGNASTGSGYSGGDSGGSTSGGYQPNSSYQQTSYDAAPSRSSYQDGSTPSFTQGTTYDGAQPADLATAAANAKIVAGVAREMGIDPATAVAVMLVESGGNNRAVGDNGSSYGLFQLHRGGELGNLSPEQAFDPTTNARVALAEFQRNESRFSDPGQLAAASQRPAAPSDYAAKVNASLPEAKQLLAEADSITAGAPPPGSFNEKLVAAIHVQDAQMSGTGYCAAAVQKALASCGLPEFSGSGNAWDMLKPLQDSGKFSVVAASQAAPGDIIVRPPASGGSVYGDISVVTAKNGNQITQTNDASYAFDPGNPRYGGQAVFLRYTGDKKLASENESTTHKHHKTQNA